MENGKDWQICYSIRHKDGLIEECRATLRAPSIMDALLEAKERITIPRIDNDKDVYDIVIWNVGIIDEEVF